MSAGTRRREPLLVRLGLHRPELRAWALYDWAISGFQTDDRCRRVSDLLPSGGPRRPRGTVAAEHYAVSNSISIAIVALLCPCSARLPTTRRPRNGCSACSSAWAPPPVAPCTSSSTATCCWPRRCCAASIAAAASTVFYEALLPHVAREDEMDRVSSAGYAIGYLGGGVLLALNLAWILAPGAFRVALRARISRRVSRRSRCASRWSRWRCGGCCFRSRCSAASPSRLASSKPTSRAGGIRWAWRSRDCRKRCASCAGTSRPFLMLVAFLIYNDGIATIQRMATAYGTGIGLPQNALITAILLVQFIGVPCTPALRCARRVDRREARGVSSASPCTS